MAPVSDAGGPSSVRRGRGGEEEVGLETWDAIRSRRDVRQFEERPIPDEHLDRILEAPPLAPTSSPSATRPGGRSSR